MDMVIGIQQPETKKNAGNPNIINQTPVSLKNFVTKK